MKKTVAIALISGMIFSGAHALFIDVQNNSPFKIELSYDNPQGIEESKIFDAKDTTGSLSIPYCPPKITAKALSGKYVGKASPSLAPINCKRIILEIKKGDTGIEITQRE